MAYLGTSINESPVLACLAGETSTDFRATAVKFDANGKVVLAKAKTDIVLGIVIMTNDTPTAVGDQVDVQIKDIGVARSGAAFAAGDELTVDTQGRMVKAVAGDNVCAIALKAATAADEYPPVMITRYTKPSA